MQQRKADLFAEWRTMSDEEILKKEEVASEMEEEEEVSQGALFGVGCDK